MKVIIEENGNYIKKKIYNWNILFYMEMKFIFKGYVSVYKYFTFCTYIEK